MDSVGSDVGAPGRGRSGRIFWATVFALAACTTACRERPAEARPPPEFPPARFAHELPARCDGSFPLARRWGKTREEMDVSSIGPVRVGPDGTLYFGARKTVRAVAPDGREKWSFEAPSIVSSRPLHAGDALFASDGYRSVFLLDAATGRERWLRGLGGWNYASPGHGPDGLLLEGCWNGMLYAFRRTGEVVWGYRTEAWIFSTPLVVGSNIYFGSGDAGVYSLDASGQLRWRHLTAGEVNASPVEGPGGEIIVGSHDGRVYAFSTDGELLWRHDVGAEIVAAALVEDGRIYVPALDGSLTALASDGSLVWRWRGVGGLLAPPVATRRGRIAVVTDRGETCLVDRAGATVACVVRASAGPQTGVALGSAGELVVTGDTVAHREDVLASYEECP